VLRGYWWWNKGENPGKGESDCLEYSWIRGATTERKKKKKFRRAAIKRDFYQGLLNLKEVVSGKRLSEEKHGVSLEPVDLNSGGGGHTTKNTN